MQTWRRQGTEGRGAVSGSGWGQSFFFFFKYIYSVHIDAESQLVEDMTCIFLCGQYTGGKLWLRPSNCSVVYVSLPYLRLYTLFIPSTFWAFIEAPAQGT